MELKRENKQKTKVGKGKRGGLRAEDRQKSRGRREREGDREGLSTFGVVWCN